MRPATGETSKRPPPLVTSGGPDAS